MLAPTLAFAHASERRLNVTAVAPGTGNAKHVIFGALSFGAFVSADGGKRFDWICEEALLGPTDNDALVAVADARTLLYGDVQAGLAISFDTGCSWQAVEAFKPPFRLRDMRVHPIDRRRILVVGDLAGEAQGSLWHSEDGGHVFEPLSNAPERTFPTAVAVSEAAPHRVWLAGTDNSALRSAKLLVSQDDGRTFVQRDVAGAPPMVGAASLAPHPSDPDQLLVGFLDLTTGGTQVLKSNDGGLHFHRVLLVREPVRNLAFADSGVVWVSGTTRTYRSRDEGEHFEQFRAPSANGCSAAAEGEQWLCGDEAKGDAFSLARSSDGGAHLRPALRFSKLVGPYRCGPQAPLSEVCRPLWPLAAQRLGAKVPPPRAPAKPL